MTESNFDLLDSTIDELADLEAFTPIPAGSHLLIITWETKEINDKPSVIMGLKVVETLEMANAAEEAPEPGKTSDIAFILVKDDGEPNTMGQGQLKEVLTALQPTFGGDSLRETMEASNNAEVVATLKVRANKKDPDQKYNSIVTIAVPE